MRLTPQVMFSYWQRYVRRRMDKVALRRIYGGELFGWRETRLKKWLYTENRPWTDANISENSDLRKVKKNWVLVEPIRDEDWMIFKGDRVEILVGKDKGKQGIVNSIIKERNWCYVEGLNCKYEMQEVGRGISPMVIKTETPLLVTHEVKLVDPSDEKSTKIEWRYTEMGDHVRVSMRTGRIIPIPVAARQLEDFIHPDKYVEQEKKDTLAKDLTEVTFVPKLKTFDQDILEQFNIKDDRKAAKTYWY